jgi:hypothetical protein
MRQCGHLVAKNSKLCWQLKGVDEDQTTRSLTKSQLQFEAAERPIAPQCHIKAPKTAHGLQALSLVGEAQQAKTITGKQSMCRPIYLPSLHQVKKPRREGGKRTPNML